MESSGSKYISMMEPATNSRKTYKDKFISSVAEPNHFYAAPAPGKNLDAAPAPAPTLLYSKAKFLK
jgi:hypothetical protein